MARSLVDSAAVIALQLRLVADKPVPIRAA